MPLYNPVVYTNTPTMTDSQVFDSVVFIESGKTRFFPSFELTIDADMEIPLESDVEVIS